MFEAIPQIAKGSASRQARNPRHCDHGPNTASDPAHQKRKTDHARAPRFRWIGHGIMNSRGILPQSNYIDKQGKLAYAHGFVSGDEEIIEKAILKLLEKSKVKCAYLLGFSLPPESQA